MCSAASWYRVKARPSEKSPRYRRAAAYSSPSDTGISRLFALASAMAFNSPSSISSSVDLGQRVQRLRGEGLLVSVTMEGNKHPPHRLSDVGEEVWSYNRPFRPPPRSVVLEHVRSGIEDLHSRTGQPGGEWQPNERAIAMLRVMDAMAPPRSAKSLSLWTALSSIPVPPISH